MFLIGLIVGLLIGLFIGLILGLMLLACIMERESNAQWLLVREPVKPTYRDDVCTFLTPDDPWYAWALLALMIPGAQLGYWLDMRKRARLLELAAQS